MYSDAIRQRGIDFELTHWRKKLAQQGGYRNMEDVELSSSIAAYLPPLPGGQNRLKVLDVGCGPTSIIGGMHNGNRLDIVGVDPLGNEYEKLLQEFGISQSIKTVPCSGEDLLLHFEKNSFDLVFSRNALDHAQEPHKAIASMLEVCKEGCCVVFKVNLNEGLNTRYHGFHQWNFTEVGGTLLIWNPYEAYSLDKCINGMPYFIISETIPGSKQQYPFYLTCVIHKLSENLNVWLPLSEGLYAIYSKRHKFFTLTRTDIFSCDERFFLHFLKNGKAIDIVGFQWDLRQRYKSIICKEVYADALKIGQFQPYLENSPRIWEKILPI